MDVFRQELRYALRSLRRTPLLSLVVIAALSSGIALVTTFFSFVNSAFYHPLPYKDSDRIIQLGPYGISAQALGELKTTSRALERVATFLETRSILSGQGAPAVEIPVTKIDSSVFPLLQAQPILGNLPTPREIADRAPILVINERLWRNRFGSRPDIIGLTVSLDGTSRLIVAVMPGWFTFQERAQAWQPFAEMPDDASSPRIGVVRVYSIRAVGKLAPGATLADAQRDVDLVAARLRSVDSIQFRSARRAGFYLTPDMVDRGRGRGFITTLIWLVVGGAVCVLLVACTNVASLMLARAARRRGEMVIRASLGASHWQLVRQQLIESVVLAGIAGVVGTLLSIWGIHLVVGMLPPVSREWLPGWVYLGIDGRVLVFAAGVSLLTVLIFGLWPARAGTRFDLTSVLRSAADRSLTGRDPTRRLHLPVVLELTLSLVLFVGAVMMLRSFHAIASADRGFQLADRTRARVGYDRNRDTIAADYTRYLVALRERIQATSPGIGVTLISDFFQFPGAAPAPADGIVVDETGKSITWQELRGSPPIVSDDYFRVLGIPILAGRPFDSTDVVSSTPVAVVSRALAMDLWGTPNVLGRQLAVARTRVTVIGIAGDVRHPGGRSGGLAPARELYLAERQALTCCNRGSFIVHSRLEPRALAALVSRSLASLGRDLPVTVVTLTEEEERASIMERMLSAVLGTFALVGLVLAVMGIYGVVAFSVEQRTREIGVRIALGATPLDVLKQVMAGGLKLVGIAMAIGLAASALAGKVLTAFVVGSFAGHVLTALGVSALFALIALAACYLPARRSATIDPLAALRAE